MEEVLAKAYRAEDFREKAHAVVDLLAQRMALGERTIPWVSLEEQVEFWRKDFASPTLADPVELFRQVMDRSIDLHHPGYMGHQVSVPLPISSLVASVTAFMNQGIAVYEMGMVGNALEKIVLEHLAQKLGFPSQASGLITSGGTLANLTALLTARAAFGEDEIQDLVVLVSGEAHYSIQRAVKIMGIPESNLLQVPVNEKFQMRTELLDPLYEQCLSAGKKPLCVVGCACSTALGAYDDLQAIGKWAAKRKVWFHVDGAHGAAVAYSPDHRHLIRGIALADSVILDFHKLMMVPSLCTAVLYRDGTQAKRTFAQKADYLFGEEVDPWYHSGKRTFECTKPMNILQVYTILRVHGEKIFRENVDRLYGLAREFAALVAGRDDFELAVPPQSNMVCFRYVGSGDPDATNRAILEGLLEDGTYYIVKTLIHGEFWLRVTLQNPLTTTEHLQGLLSKITQLQDQGSQGLDNT